MTFAAPWKSFREIRQVDLCRASSIQGHPSGDFELDSEGLGFRRAPRSGCLDSGINLTLLDLGPTCRSSPIRSELRHENWAGPPPQPGSVASPSFGVRRCGQLGSRHNIALHLTSAPMPFHSGRAYQSFRELRPRRLSLGLRQVRAGSVMRPLRTTAAQTVSLSEHYFVGEVCGRNQLEEKHGKAH